MGLWGAYRIPRLSQELTGAIDSIKRSVRIHSTANTEIGATLETARSVAERQQQSCLELGRAFENLASDYVKRSELKARQVTHKKPLITPSLKRVAKTIERTRKPAL